MFLFKDKKIDSFDKLLKDAVGKMETQEEADLIYKCVSEEFGVTTARHIFGFFLGYFKTPEDRARISKALQGVEHPLWPWISRRDPTQEEAITLGIQQMLVLAVNKPPLPTIAFSTEDHTPSKLTVFEEREAKADWNI